MDVSPDTVLLASGAADNTVRLWNVKTGECVKVWDFPTAVKRVEFSADGSRLLAVTEKRMGYLGTIVVYDIQYGENLEDQTDEPSLKITCEESKATVAGWSYLNKYIIAGHEDGSVSQYDAKVRETIYSDLKCFGVILWGETDIRINRLESNWRMSRRTSSTCWLAISNSPPTAHTSLLLRKIRLQRYGMLWPSITDS